MKRQDAYRGCLIGGAAGDVLGYPVEFLAARNIFDQFGPEGITTFNDLEYGYSCGRISDDTQMTLFTAAGLQQVNAVPLSDEGAVQVYVRSIRDAYIDWYSTQTRRYPLAEEEQRSWLLDIPELFNRRAPGNTCMSACRVGATGSVAQPINNSCGCGGVMRVAPIGLRFDPADTPVNLIQHLGAEAAACTHGHPLGYLPAAVMVHMVSLLAHDPAVTILEAAKSAMSQLPESFPDVEQVSDLLTLLKQAVALAQTEMADLDAVHQLGGGWTGHEALAIALYCAVRHETDFERALVAAVNHDGDSDSTGSIAGSLVGAHLGLGGIPQKYKEKLELQNVILTLADSLYDIG